MYGACPGIWNQGKSLSDPRQDRQGMGQMPHTLERECNGRFRIILSPPSSFTHSHPYDGNWSPSKADAHVGIVVDME